MKNTIVKNDEINWVTPELIIESWEVTESLGGFINVSP